MDRPPVRFAVLSLIAGAAAAVAVSHAHGQAVDPAPSSDSSAAPATHAAESRSQATSDDAPSEAEVAEPHESERDPVYSGGEGEEFTPAVDEWLDLQRRGMFDIRFIEGPIEAANTLTDRLERETGFRLRIAYTTLFQQATGGPGERTRMSGDLDLMSTWHLVDRNGPNRGTLVTTGEYRHQIGWENPNSLRDDVGTLQRTTGGFDDRGWAFRDFYYLQRLFDDKLRVAFGRADVSDFVGSHQLQGINGSFSNRAFSADSTTAYPAGHVLAAGASIRPVDWFYFTAGGTNAYGRSTISDLQFIDEGKFFTFGEVGFTPTIDGLGKGRYALLGWHMDERDLLELPSDAGFTVILEQSLSDRLRLFARHGWANDGVLTGIKRSTQGGLGITGLLGNDENLTGIAFGFSEPLADARDEKTIECFHRFQLTAHTQFSVGVQAIFDPSRAPDDDAIGVLTVRFRVAF